MRVETVSKFACDFCGRTQDEVKKLTTAHRHVAICDECVAICVDILAAPDEPKQTAIPTQVPIVRDWRL